MKTFWLSWYDDPKGPKGKQHPTKKIETWRSGYRCDDFSDATMKLVMTALVDAETEAEAWGALDIEYPAVPIDERRFATEHELGWRPQADRFPR